MPRAGGDIKQVNANLGEWSSWCQGLGRVTYKHRTDPPRTQGGKKHLSSGVLNARGQGTDECRCLSWERQARDKSKRQWVASPCRRVPSPCHKATPPSRLVTRIQFTSCVELWRKRQLVEKMSRAEQLGPAEVHCPLLGERPPSSGFAGLREDA